MSGSNLTEAAEGIKNGGSTLAAANKGELFSSFDVDAFEIPGGRDELWRFTPLKRLRGLHDGSASATSAARVKPQSLMRAGSIALMPGA